MKKLVQCQDDVQFISWKIACEIETLKVKVENRTTPFLFGWRRKDRKQECQFVKFERKNQWKRPKSERLNVKKLCQKQKGYSKIVFKCEYYYDKC